MKILYHYCSTDTFFKILNSKEIWMSNIFNMNDYLEYIWLFEIIKKHKQSKFYDFVFKCFNEKMNNNFVFISCFSEESDLLSQWRGYADDGKGFSIGFKKEMLKKIANLHKVTYSITDIPKEVEESLLSNKENSKNWISNFKVEIEKYAPITKNHKFSEEKEWRLIEIISKKDDLSTIKWRNSSDKIIPYIKKSFENELISEIIIGPKNNTLIEDMQLFLNSLGLKDIKVIKSEISYG